MTPIEPAELGATPDPRPAADQRDRPDGNPGRGIVQSRVTEGDLTCPSCGRTDQVAMWDLLEASCNPERTAQLASGALLVHTCQHCGALLPLDYPLFFVDRNRKTAAFYPAGQGDIAALKTLFTQAIQRFRGIELAQLRKNEFVMRVVPQRHELAEKVSAWQAGLDDELLEVFKVSLLRELNSQNPERSFCDAQFTGLADEGEKLSFVLFVQGTLPDGTPGATPANAAVAVPAEAYRRLGRSLDVRQAIDLHRSPVVDAAWAREVLAGAEALARSAAGR